MNEQSLCIDCKFLKQSKGNYSCTKSIFTQGSGTVNVLTCGLYKKG